MVHVYSVYHDHMVAIHAVGVSSPVRWGGLTGTDICIYICAYEILLQMSCVNTFQLEIRCWS